MQTSTASDSKQLAANNQTLISAATYGQLPIIQYLVESPEQPVDIFESDFQAIRLAASNNFFDIVSYLIDAIFPEVVLSVHNNCLLSDAIRHQNFDAVRYFLETLERRLQQYNATPGTPPKITARQAAQEDLERIIADLARTGSIQLFEYTLSKLSPWVAEIIPTFAGVILDAAAEAETADFLRYFVSTLDAAHESFSLTRPIRRAISNRRLENAEYLLQLYATTEAGDFQLPEDGLQSLWSEAVLAGWHTTAFFKALPINFISTETFIRTLQDALPWKDPAVIQYLLFDSVFSSGIEDLVGSYQVRNLVTSMQGNSDSKLKILIDFLTAFDTEVVFRAAQESLPFHLIPQLALEAYGIEPDLFRRLSEDDQLRTVLRLGKPRTVALRKFLATCEETEVTAPFIEQVLCSATCRKLADAGLLTSIEQLKKLIADASNRPQLLARL